MTYMAIICRDTWNWPKVCAISKTFNFLFLGGAIGSQYSSLFVMDCWNQNQKNQFEEQQNWSSGGGEGAIWGALQINQSDWRVVLDKFKLNANQSSRFFFFGGGGGGNCTDHWNCCPWWIPKLLLIKSKRVHFEVINTLIFGLNSSLRMCCWSIQFLL